MSLIGLIIILVVVAFMMWWINGNVPMEPNIKKVLNVVVFLVVLLWVLSIFGILPDLNVITVGK